MLQEGEGEHCHERMAMETLPGSPFEVIEAKFLFQLLMGLLANPSCLDGGRQGTQTGRAIVNAGLSRGTRIPRQGRWYDPFCPKILGILGKTKLPRTIASRSIILRMWPKKPDEKTEDFAYADDPEFSTIWRKLARWASDNVRIIKNLKPPQPPGFNNRLSANWKLLLQIAQHAGGGWPEQARRSAIYLSRAPYEPSVGVQLLAALRAMFAKNRTQITSEQVVQELLADPDLQWHEYRSRGPITKNQVAALLKDFEIRPVVVHPTKRADLSRHGYRAAQFEDAFGRFLSPEPNIRTLKRGAAKRRESVRMFG